MLKLTFSQEADLSSFENKNISVKPADVAGYTSPSNRSINIQNPTSTTAFDSSGFAAHSGSSTSPFGTLSASITADPTSSPFLRSTPTSVFTSDTITSGGLNFKKDETTVDGGFGLFATNAVRGFGATEPPPFTTSVAPQSGVFGGSIFGGGFGGGFGNGGRLTSFAAPVGDAHMGNASGTIKRIGSPAHEREENDDDEAENSGIEGERTTGKENFENDEVDDRFQHQDGKPPLLNL